MEDCCESAAVGGIERTVLEEALIKIGGPTEVAKRLRRPVEAIFQCAEIVSRLGQCFKDAGAWEDVGG